LGWAKYKGIHDLLIEIDHYGANVPAEKLAEEYGFASKKFI
jgi:transketolase